MRNTIKSITPILFFILIIGVLVFTTYNTFLLKESFTKNIELIIKSDTTQKETIDYNHKIELLKSEIQKVEEVNNSRFDLIGWGFGLLITILTVLFVINHFYSKSEAIDIINEQFKDINKEFIIEYDKLTNDLKGKSDQLNKELERIRKIK